MEQDRARRRDRAGKYASPRPSTSQQHTTGAGAALLPEARATLNAAQAAQDAVRAAQDTLRGTVNVGAMASVEVVDLPALLGQLHARHPAIDVRLRLATAGSAGLAHALLSGDLDVAFLSLPERKPAGIDARELATVPLVPVVSAVHPLAQQGKVALADLAAEPFVDFPPGYGNREVVDRAFAAAGVVRRVALEVPDIDMGAALVRHGLGIAFLPAFAVARTPGLHVLDVLDVLDTTLRWSMHLGTSSTRRPSSALRALLDLVDLHVIAL
ncbi:LysR substrate-binding domain-containing protein [Streptomyces hygroscopicus]|uniref:LysR substrate-binding domain-containing protein n=1 Tax=Streptomyces hygroscopicus TaxID=1912 RepID=UPI00223FD55D|nr:LysR substrate-binding domain-containing protein [Streptomyces hygroscopicus]